VNRFDPWPKEDSGSFGPWIGTALGNRGVLPHPAQS